MKVLIAYDGSDCSDAALEDLKHAGLPEVGEAIVLSAADVVSRLRQVVGLGVIAGHGLAAGSNEEVRHHRIEEAQSLDDSAAARLRADFPKWKIETEVLAEGAEEAIVLKANSWQPDLLLVGSHGLVGLRRITLGSVSEYVLNHTTCSVRVGRRRTRGADHPLRILIGTDGSTDATSALKSVASRQWPADTEVRVLSVVDSRTWLLNTAAAVPETMCLPDVKNELEQLSSKVALEAVEQLQRSGIKATSRVHEGNPAFAVLDEAEQWDADCIFVGARGLNALGRIVLGSVSNHVATHAHCSVEVVRNSGQC